MLGDDDDAVALFDGVAAAGHDDPAAGRGALRAAFLYLAGQSGERPAPHDERHPRTHG